MRAATPPTGQRPRNLIRVLYVNPFAQLISGADESLLDLIRGLRPLGVDPHVALPKGSPLATRYVEAGAHVHPVSLSALKRSLRPWSTALYAYRLALGSVEVARVARSIRADLIHTNMEATLDGGLAAAALRIPHVLHYRGNTRDDPKVIFDFLAWVWTSLADRVICISHQTRRIFERRGLGARVDAIYDAIPVAAFRLARRSESVRRELGARPGDVLIGTVARMHPRKDLETFVEACARTAPHLPSARFTIVGGAHDDTERSYEARLRDLTARRGIGTRMVFAGVRFDMPEVMHALDVFVLPSRNEGFGRVVAEAMAANVPSVLANEGAFVELSLHGRAAILCEPGHPGAFADAIERVASDESLRSSLLHAAGALVDMFEPSRVADEVFERYREAIANRARRR